MPPFLGCLKTKTKKVYSKKGVEKKMKECFFLDGSHPSLHFFSFFLDMSAIRVVSA